MAVEVVYRRRRGRRRPPAEVRTYKWVPAMIGVRRSGLLENGLPANADLRAVYLEDRRGRVVMVL